MVSDNDQEEQNRPPNDSANQSTGSDWNYFRYGYGYPGHVAPNNARITHPWEVPGPHTGRGPRNFQMSDDTIREDVCERLTHNGAVDAGDIEVSVKNGEVTLTGTVKNRNEKHIAEEVADSVLGVRDVFNNLHVSSLQQGQRTYAYGQAPEWTGSLQQGLQVTGLDGNTIGTVKQVGGAHFLVDIPMKRDLYVPYMAIDHITGNQVVLNVKSDQIDSLGWSSPNLINT